MVLGGVPQLTRDRIQAQSRYNGLAAAFAGVTAICQAILMAYATETLPERGER